MAWNQPYVKAAERILEAFWGDRGFPVDPVYIANELGIKVVRAPLPPRVSGALVKMPGEDPVILIHSGDHIRRQRFTCAHELGHYVYLVRSNEDLESFEVVDLRSPLSSQGTDPKERFANNFAANLLMPRAEVRRLLAKGYDELEMARYFGVSEEAMRYRVRFVQEHP